LRGELAAWWCAAGGVRGIGLPRSLAELAGVMLGVTRGLRWGVAVAWKGVLAAGKLKRERLGL